MNGSRYVYHVKLNATIISDFIYVIGASTVAVPGANIFFRGHYAADARGREAVHTS